MKNQKIEQAYLGKRVSIVTKENSVIDGVIIEEFVEDGEEYLRIRQDKRGSIRCISWWHIRRIHVKDSMQKATEMREGDSYEKEVLQDIWPRVLEKFRCEYCTSSASYEAWVAPMTVHKVIDGIAYIHIPIKESLEHIKHKFCLPMFVCIAEVTGKEYEIQFVSD
jgi:hypothetical protein